MPDSFEVAIEEHLDRAVIKVFGELDIATGPELAAALAGQAAQCRSILLDLRGVEFMESTGLHLLIQARESALHDGLGFELITSKAVDRTLETAAACRAARRSAARDRDGLRVGGMTQTSAPNACGSSSGR